MTKKSKIEIIDLNVKDGLKLKAVLQLGSLIDSNPNNLNLRDRLAEIYYDAGFLDAAGKFWLLNDSQEFHIRNCVELYEKSVSYSGNQILQDLKFKGDKLQLSEYAQNKLTQLETDSLKKTNYIPIYKPKAKDEIFKTEKKKPFKEKLGYIIICGIVIFFLTSLFVGISTIFNWIF